ncbi:unnamed protein product [Mytilus coruscus]|uniref:Uncharacterized protein n=1 Tax=Mytilus coruscus TaxID=42192 RepID=A0A6J8EVZ5_MYTCO|nr:unnamed protein product [Mytilus coruscus]
MEPDMALEMTHNLKDNGRFIHVLHADNDSTTTARLEVDFKELQKSKVKEATTYENNVEVNELIPDIQEISSPKTINESDNFVIFYLKTTGLSRKIDITQIAAACGSNTFQRYVIPRLEITQEACTITGITFSHSSNKMYLIGTIVETCFGEQSLLVLIDLLKLNNIPILVGHKIANLDMLVL